MKTSKSSVNFLGKKNWNQGGSGSNQVSMFPNWPFIFRKRSKEKWGNWLILVLRGPPTIAAGFLKSLILQSSGWLFRNLSCSNLLKIILCFWWHLSFWKLRIKSFQFFSMHDSHMQKSPEAKVFHEKQSLSKKIITLLWNIGRNAFSKLSQIVQFNLILVGYPVIP